MKKVLIFLLYVLCFSTCVSSLFLIIKYLVGYRQAENEYNAIIKDVIENQSSEDGSTEVDSKNKYSFPKIKFNRLAVDNKDVVGWIQIKDTPINYPIVQSEDNEYYLSHTFEKSSNFSGAIFIDSNCSNDFTNLNTIIYGHNLKNGKMFGYLQHYNDQKYFRNHKSILIMTPKKNYVYDSFLYKEVPYDSDYYSIDFEEDSLKSDWIEMVNKDIKKFDNHFSQVDEIKSSDTIITLSTCSSRSTYRRILQGKLIYQEEVDK